MNALALFMVDEQSVLRFVISVLSYAMWEGKFAFLQSVIKVNMFNFCVWAIDKTKAGRMHLLFLNIPLLILDVCIV